MTTCQEARARAMSSVPTVALDAAVDAAVTHRLSRWRPASRGPLDRISSSNQVFRNSMYPDFERKRSVHSQQPVDLKTLCEIAEGEYKDSQRLRILRKVLAEIDDLVGMKAAKRQIINLVMLWLRGVKILHVAICGPDGCGKTLLSGLVLRLFSEMYPTKKLVEGTFSMISTATPAEAVHCAIGTCDFFFMDNIKLDNVVARSALCEQLKKQSTTLVITGTREDLLLYDTRRFETWIEIEPYTEEEYATILSRMLGVRVPRRLVSRSMALSCRSIITLGKKIIAANALGSVGMARSEVSVEDIDAGKADFSRKEHVSLSDHMYL